MAAKKSIRSNSKSIVEENKRMILQDMEPYGGKTRKQVFAREVDGFLDSKYSGSNKRMYPTPYKAVEEMVDGVSIGDPDTYSRARYLNKIGLTKYDPDKKDLTDREWEEVDNLYRHIMARDGAALYEQIKKEEAAKAQAKAKPKAAVKKTASKTKGLRRQRSTSSVSQNGEISTRRRAAKAEKAEEKNRQRKVQTEIQREKGFSHGATIGFWRKRKKKAKAKR